MLHDYEKLGSFYLGRRYDLSTRTLDEAPLLYDSRHLTTHAVCLGMTGSGKTGLGLTLLEEAAIDGIPAILIDPKGDLGNLLLTFPEMQAADYEPWIDPAEAQRRGSTIQALAAETAQNWKSGLAKWDQDGQRISRFRDSVETNLYTPGSSVGRSLAVLRSFAAPDPNFISNSDAFRERISGATSGLLALLGIESDPLRSREHILSFLTRICGRILGMEDQIVCETGRFVPLPAI
jgi:Helicase HerA, central domain